MSEDILDPEIFKNGNLGFEEALILLKAGRKVCRVEWAHERSYVELLRSPDVFVMHRYEEEFKWIPSTEDLVTEDWSEA